MLGFSLTQPMDGLTIPTTYQKKKKKKKKKKERKKERMKERKRNLFV